MPDFKSAYNRRQFLIGSSALSLTAAVLPTALEAQAGGQAQSSGESAGQIIPTPDTVLKFNPDGTRRAFAGNTVICHVSSQTMVHDAIAALGQDLRSRSFAGKLGILPNDSYHMTVFPGANDQGRSAHNWPADIPIDAPIKECDRVIGDRMKQFRLGCSLPLRVVVDIPTTMAYGLACTLRMSPLDETENAKLRLLRDRLSGVYRFRTKDHDTYTFHITVAYQMASFKPNESAMYRELLQHHLPRIAAASPVIELGMPEYCTFEDMYRFEVRSLLAT